MEETLWHRETKRVSKRHICILLYFFLNYCNFFRSLKSSNERWQEHLRRFEVIEGRLTEDESKIPRLFSITDSTHPMSITNSPSSRRVSINVKGPPELKRYHSEENISVSGVPPYDSSDDDFHTPTSRKVSADKNSPNKSRKSSKSWKQYNTNVYIKTVSFLWNHITCVPTICCSANYHNIVFIVTTFVITFFVLSALMNCK